jgi:hypothetical protein
VKFYANTIDIDLEKEMNIGRTLRTVLLSFAGGASRTPARPLRRFSIWDVKPNIRGIVNMVDREGTHGQVAIKEVTDKNINPHRIVGVTIFFPFIQPITERIDKRESTLGYLCHLGKQVVCYDAVGGKPILYETGESRRQREREETARGFIFQSSDSPDLTVEGQSGRVIEDRFYPLDDSPSEEGGLSICLTARMGNRIARIGYSTTQTFNLKRIIAGQEDFIQPVFDDRSFLRGTNINMAQASLVGLVQRKKGDTSN